MDYRQTNLASVRASSRSSTFAVIVLFAALGCQLAAAQPPPSAGQRVVHESWTFKDGAPAEPTAFAQTADGYLWVGAPEGLFRFDGVRFELFRSPFGEQLQSTNVSALFAADDRLWVGYIFGGFSYLQKGSVRNFVETTGTVTGFAQDTRGTIWAGASGAGKSGLWRFDGASWQQIGAAWKAPDRGVAQLGFDRDGILWVLSGARGAEAPKQLYFLAPGQRQFRKAGDRLFVSSFTWDADNHVVSTRERGRDRPGTSFELASSLPAYPILKPQSDQILDRADGIWFIPEQGRMVLRHPAGEPLAEIIGSASPGDSEIVRIDPRAHARLVDREGGIWFGTETGVHRFSYSPLMAQELPQGPAPWFMLAPDAGGVVWISAGNGAGTSALYRVTDGKVDLQRSIAGVSSFAYRAPDQTLWFGGEGGLWHLADGRLANIELPQELAERAGSLVTMTHDPAGGFWVSFGGLGLYRLVNGAWTQYAGRREPSNASATTACPRSGVVSAFTDSLKRVWLGCTKNQLTMLDADGERTFGPGEGVRTGNITAIYGRGAAIWIGGEFGLQQFDRGRFHMIRTVDDESLRGISGIVETANGDLWLNGLGGIVHIRRGEIQKGLKNPGYPVSAERYDRRAGLPGLPSQLRRAPTAIEGTDGRLWFAVTSGVVWLDPTGAANRTAPPPVSIQSISADGKAHGLDGHPRFPAGTANVEISYAAVSLMHPEAVRFRYKLQEIDNNWHEAGRSTSVSYRSLPPGTYHFEAGASDTNGLWSDQTAMAEFTILPAYYQTAWFRGLCALLVLLLAWAGYRLRIRRLHRQFEMTLDARVAERTRIARDLHDTLLQGFHGLLLRFQTACNLLPDRPAESKEVLARAIDQAAEAITEGRDAIQGLRNSATETNDLADSLRGFAEDLANDSGNAASLQIEVQGTPRVLHPIVRDEVFRITGEALRNAFRHAGAKRIEVELRYDEQQLRVRVRDDGKGIDPAVLRAGGREGHFGLGGMRERAKLAGGRLTVWSGPDAGTEVELRVPGLRAYSSPP